MLIETQKVRSGKPSSYRLPKSPRQQLERKKTWKGKENDRKYETKDLRVKNRHNIENGALVITK